MSKFKGTQGKWALGGMSGRMIKSTLPTEFGFIADVDTRVNALLISKAPEMLELLTKVVEIQDKYFGDVVKTHLALAKISADIELLIKEATTI